jgi:mRNA-degrading endonuclease RelE of RelBE toxin-antitoxin system
LPKGIQKRVARTFTQMAGDPFEVNVKALKGGEWRRVFRRRIGDYRIQTVFILRILIRSKDLPMRGRLG